MGPTSLGHIFINAPMHTWLCVLCVLSLIDTFSQQHETHWNEAGLKSAMLSPEALLHSGT